MREVSEKWLDVPRKYYREKKNENRKRDISAGVWKVLVMIEKNRQIGLH